MPPDDRRHAPRLEARHQLALAWVRGHVTAKRLLDEGRIGDLVEVHFYDGNRGPLYHLADKVEVSDDEVERQKPQSWFYKADRGGGSLIDYLGYGTTLGTWFHNGTAPIEMTAVIDHTPGIEVDQHSVTVARYAQGLSKFETRWGTISDPWTQQPIPRCGFVLVGTKGAIASVDYGDNHHGAVARRRAGAHPCRRARPRPRRTHRLHGRPHSSRPAGRRSAQPCDESAGPAHDRHRAGVLDRQAHSWACFREHRGARLASDAVPEIAPPVLDYLPPMPSSRAHPIALIGAGGIASAHLDAYRRAGFNVRIIASPTLAHAVARRDAFFPRRRGDRRHRRHHRPGRHRRRRSDPASPNSVPR